jgi:hypothetical protein
MYTLKIMWGEFTDSTTTPEVYEFSTEAEREAFLWGVEEMNGWLDYEIVEKSDEES